MLDTLVIHVPMRAEFVLVQGNLHSVVGDISYYQLPTVPTYFKRELDGTIVHGDLFHKYESLPTSFGGMAMKFFGVNVANTRPYVSLNASVKLLQGHNICGGESVKNLACEMLGLLRSVYPEFFACLDIQQASISRIDSTFSARLENEALIQPCIRFLGNVSNGHRKADKDKRDFYNTVYWGGATSRLGGCKVYGKHCEIMAELDKLKDKFDKGFVSVEPKIKVYTPELLEWSRCLLRFESTTKRRKLEQLNIPSNLWQFIRHQGMDKTVLLRLWKLWFTPVFDAMAGDLDLQSCDDAEVYELCRSHFVSVGRTGKPLFTRSNRVFAFYQQLKMSGFDVVRSRLIRRTFNDNVKDLVSLGFSRSDLQNIHIEKKISVPFRELVNIDFTKQIPLCYNPVISSYINDFDIYIRQSGDINYQQGLKV